jgi:hypothetical protein
VVDVNGGKGLSLGEYASNKKIHVFHRDKGEAHGSSIRDKYDRVVTKRSVSGVSAHGYVSLFLGVEVVFD